MNMYRYVYVTLFGGGDEAVIAARRTHPGEVMYMCACI